MTEPYFTKTGKVLTDAELAKLADEAERGYPVRCACGATVGDDGQAHGGDEHQHIWAVSGTA